MANAEFIGALTPVILVPAGALLFKERINTRALWFGLVSFAGLMLVLFNVPANGVATWTGNLIIVCAMFSWATYLLTSRRLRAEMSVQAILCAVMMIASRHGLPARAVQRQPRRDHRPLVAVHRAAAVMTGTAAHGFIVYAQHTVPVGTISILQVAQPALAVVWAYLFLDQTIRPVQLLGMALVIAGWPPSSPSAVARRREPGRWTHPSIPRSCRRADRSPTHPTARSDTMPSYDNTPGELAGTAG